VLIYQLNIAEKAIVAVTNRKPRAGARGAPPGSSFNGKKQDIPFGMIYPSFAQDKLFRVLLGII